MQEETRKKLNKAEAGYQMLQILSAVDGKFSVDEDLIIRDYMVENFPFRINLDAAMEELSRLRKEDYIIHFERCMDDFYQDSSTDERTKFLNFVMQLISADKVVNKEENIFIRTLFDAWENKFRE